MLSLLHQHGLSSGGLVPAMEQFLGSTASLSPGHGHQADLQWRADH
ncbi:hypothetical protein ACFUVZ_43285 [Streptomyces chartreusis]